MYTGYNNDHKLVTLNLLGIVTFVMLYVTISLELDITYYEFYDIAGCFFPTSIQRMVDVPVKGTVILSQPCWYILANNLSPSDVSS